MHRKKLPGVGKRPPRASLTQALFRQFASREDRPVLILDDAGKVLQCNKACSRLFHRPAQKLTGQNIGSFWSTGDADRMSRILARARTSHAPLRFAARQDGSTIRFTITPTRDHTSKALFFLVTGNVSGTKAELPGPTRRRLPPSSDLRTPAASHLIQSILDNAPFGAHAYQLESDGRLIFLGGNRAADRILSTAHATLVGKTIEEAFPGLIGTPIPDIYRKVATDGEEYAADQVQYENGQIKGAFEIHAFRTGRRSMAVFFRDITERKRIEDDLRISQLCIDNAAIGIFLIGANGRITGANQHACTSLGYTRQELEHLTVFDIDPTFTRERWMEHRKRVREERTRTIETIHKRKDGALRFVEVTVTHMALGEREWTFSFVTDVTDRKKAEEAVREKADELDRYFSSALDLLCIADMDGYFRRLNKEWESTLGYSTRELENTRFLDHVHPDDMEATLRSIAQLGKQEEVLNFVNRYRAKDGSYRWLEWRSFPAGSLIYAAARDITDRKRTDEALRENEEKFRIAFENAPTGMSIIRSDGHYLAVNPILCEMFGYSQEELLSGTIYTITHPDDVERSNAWVRKMITGDRSEPECEKRYIHKDGHIVWGLVRAQWMRNADGTPRMSIVHILDITKRKEADERIRLMNEELEERVRERTAQLESANNELESFSYSVSHDLRAPLRAIDGYSRILMENHSSQLDEDAKKACSVVRSETQRMGRLIDDLLSFSRLGRSQMRDSVVAVGGMVEGVLQELLTPEERQRITIDVPSLPDVHADAALLRQVWVNLLSNAVKFSSKRSDPHITICTSATPSEVVFSVRDNGAGFEMQYAEKLFRVFQRLHSVREFEGTGVGLAIVQRIVNRHGGRVWAEGEPGNGATFSFSLPRKEP